MCLCSCNGKAPFKPKSSLNQTEEFHCTTIFRGGVALLVVRLTRNVSVMG